MISLGNRNRMLITAKTSRIDSPEHGAQIGITSLSYARVINLFETASYFLCAD